MSAEAYIAALKWYQDQGIDEALGDTPVDYRSLQPPKQQAVPQTAMPAPMAAPLKNTATTTMSAPLGKADAAREAIAAAKGAESLEALQEAIAGFSGIGAKETAANMVFAAGNPNADIMLIAEAPEKEDDRTGKAFSGHEGAFLDKMLAAIKLTREDNIYLTHLMNWRPAGGCTPSPADIAASLPFLEKHIALVQPKILILCGVTVAQNILGENLSLSRLRKKWHEYTPQTKGLELGNASPILARVTFAPVDLLNTPAQKRAAWEDLQEIEKKI